MSVAGDPWHPSRVGHRRVLVSVLAVCVSVALAGCGDAGLLDGVGDRTRQVVHGNTTTTTEPIAVVAGAGDEGLIESRDVLWFNDDIDPQYTGASQDVIDAVWKRQLGSRFVQASRQEIGAAIPTLAFPSLVPQQVRWVTSQLVFDEATGVLDPGTSAAFGLWTAEPYRSDTARLGVLRVGSAQIDDPAARSEIAVVAVPDGVSLGWTEAGNRYELFCRSEVSEELCLEVAESSVPLVGLGP
jgi:hypothetical protein